MSTLAVNTITDASGGSTATINAMTPTESNMMGRNHLINGDMRIWQRGTSINIAGSSTVYSVDRFNSRPNSSSGGKIEQVTDVPEGFEYSAKISRDAGNNGNQTFFQQALETKNIIPLRGKYLTLSFYAKRGANYSPTNYNIRAQLHVGTGTERARYNSPYDSETVLFSTDTALTDTWQRFTLTSSAVVPSDATQLSTGFQIIWSGTAGADDSVYITGMQLEVGSVATPFERRPYGTELALCQRYYTKFTANSNIAFGIGHVAGTTLFRLILPFPVFMRIAPSALEQTGTASDYKVWLSSDTVCSSVPSLQSATPFAAQVSFTVASGLTVGNGSQGRSAADGAYLGFTAEL